MVITPIVLLWAAVAWSVGFQLRFTHPGALLAFLGAYVVVRITQSVLYLAGRPGMSIRQKTLSLLIGTPVAAVLSLTLLVPTRYYALTRLRDNRWQTRQVKPASEPRFKAEAEAA
jgi:hypothetical protein